MTGVPLRRQLLVLVLAGVLPLAVLAGVGVELMYTSRRDVERSRADELTRSLAVAVQAELEQSVGTLQALTADPAFRGSERAPIDALLRRVLPTQGHWASLAVARPEGEVIADTDLPPALPPPPDFDAVSLERAALTAAPVIGDLTPSDEGYRFAIRVPVLRDGVVTHVLTATVLTAPIRDVLVDQQVPDDWVISVFDGQLRRVGRSRAHERFVGTAPARSLTELMRADPSSGHGVTTALEGTEHFTSYRRLVDCDWTIAAGVSVAAVNRAVLDSIALYTIALALSLIGGLGTAFALARRIDAEMTRLRDAAHALGRGEPLVAPQSTVLEIARVGVALADAAAERRAHETERDALLGRERSAREAAELASREKDEFLAMLGHELRNPLSAVSTAAMVLERGGEGQAAERARGVIVRQVAHLARLTDDLLDASRALHGKIELRREPVDLARVVAHALATLERTGRVAGHTIVADLQPAVVQGDPIRLDQVASNLLVNAVKYTPPGGTIRVRTGREGPSGVLVVADDGIGMPAALVARVFDLFVQGERALDRADGGLGIGLTLVRRLVELHGGAVSAASDGERRGSEFRVALPATEEPLAEPAPAPSGSPPRSVVVVEDNDDARDTLRALLESMGHRVSVAADGEDGLARALSIGPDLLLVDLGLPVLDGYEVARRYRAARPRDTLLVALTGYGSAEDRARAVEAGFDVHVTKPLEHGVLVALLDRCGA